MNKQPDTKDHMLWVAQQQAKLLRKVIRSLDTSPVYQEKHNVEVRDVGNAPAFVLKLMKPKTPIVVVSTKEEEPIAVKPPSPEKPMLVYGLEVIGDPLPPPFTEEEMELLRDKTESSFLDDRPEREKEKFVPLDMDLARNMLQRYNEVIDKMCEFSKIDINDLCLIFVPCDGESATDDSKVALLVSGANACDPSRYMYSLQEAYCGETKMYQLRREAILNTRAHIKPPEDPPVMCCMHFMEWDTFKYNAVKRDGTSVVSQNGITIRLYWESLYQSFLHLELFPPKITPVTLEAALDYEHDEYKSGNMHYEMVLMKELHRCVENKIIDGDYVLPYIPGGPDTNAENFAAKFMQDAAQAPMRYADQVDSVPFELHLLIQLVEDEIRPNMDFTDHMWNVLKHCKTLKEAGKVLEKIFERCIESKPFVFPNNPSTAAKIVSTMPFSKSVPSVALFVQMAAEIMREIAYIKLVRDVQFLIGALGIHDPDGSRELCGYQFPDWKDKLARVEHAQQCVELVLHAKSSLFLNSKAVLHMLKEALPLTGNNLKIKLRAEHILVILEGLFPTLRRWSFYSSRKEWNSVINTHMIASQYPIFPWVPSVMLPLTEYDEREDTPIDLFNAYLPLSRLRGHIFCTILHDVCTV